MVEGRTLMIVDRHVSDDDYLSFYGSLSEVLQMVMDLVYRPGPWIYGSPRWQGVPSYAVYLGISRSKVRHGQQQQS